MNSETIKLLRKEAKIHFKKLSLRDQLKVGSYKALYLEFKDAYKKKDFIRRKENA